MEKKFAVMFHGEHVIVLIYAVTKIAVTVLLKCAVVKMVAIAVIKIYFAVVRAIAVNLALLMEN
uniref:Uncharacterized protein n=1 Tax=Meloidogyne enterolobii TaxID=390850 RepID=A0A6V7VT23_MELEN|nr:unnamed protein product [Meloidogyne enterolobii]